MARIGTSGWQYDHWVGRFYPDKTAREEMLRHYSTRLGTVEVNGTFYGLPSEETLEGWRNAVPERFEFSVKGSRYLTHMKKLSDPEEPLDRLLERVNSLGDRLGPVLFQLPPRWRRDTARLASFLEILPEGRRYAIELRDESWFHRDVYDLLRERGIAFCIYHLAGRLSPKEVTADLVYVRLHGPGAAYEGSYDDRTLQGWAGAISSWESAGHEVYCYFDNDQRGYAAENALRLAAMTGG